MVTIPAETATAKHFIIARADAEDVSAESNEADNTRAKTIYVGPDLRVAKVTAPASAAAGQIIDVSDTTQNPGGADTGTSTITRFYLSINKKLDPSDVPLGPGRTVPSVAAGASDTASTSVTIPPGTTPRAYFILARADDEEEVVETREKNNAKTVPITVN
jgi:subtilase family serine protease